jgi:glycosyltransferase involved in cell wall biosynthesis
MSQGDPAFRPHEGQVPLFSIVIPCFDPPAQFLRDCLESVVSQTEENWEAIVVDDGSVQVDVADLVQGGGDPRIHLVRHAQNRGEAASRNSGIRVARGERIVALDADDRLVPDFLRKTASSFDASPGTDWVLIDRQLFGSGTDVLRYPVPLPPPCPVHFNAQTPGMIRRSLWEDIGGYSEEGVFRSGGADLDFWMSAVERGVVVGHVAEPLYLWRMHERSVSRTSFPYHNHLIHRALYRRHRELFRSYVHRCPRCRGSASLKEYLGQGYAVAAAASLQRGERARALYLAVRGILLDRRRENLRLLARTATPSGMARARRMLLHRASQRRGSDRGTH